MSSEHEATAPDALLVDVHTHVVSPDRERYPLDPRDLSGPWYLEAPASAEDLARAMDRSGVAQAVLVQGVGAYSFDNAYAADAAAADPTRFVSACCIDPLAEDAVATLDYWIRERGMAGVRLFALARDGDSWLCDEATFPVWQRAHALGAHVIVTILPHQLDELDRVLDRFPEIPVSLDHCGFATAEPDAEAQLVALAAHESLHLKISTHNLDDAVSRTGSARTLVTRLAEAFGADRLMWGSDFCQTHDRPYETLAGLARDAFGGLSDEDRHHCSSGTARRLWPGLAKSPRANETLQSEALARSRSPATRRAPKKQTSAESSGVQVGTSSE